MTTTRTARSFAARTLALLTMGALAAVPVLPHGDLPSATPAVVPHHHRGMMPLHQQGTRGAASRRAGSTTGPSLDHASGDGGRGVDGRLEYFGGRVISNVKVYDIFWGAGVDPTYQAQIGGFYSAILTSSYWTWLAEYDTTGLMGAANNQPGSNQTIGAGSFAGAIPITPQNQNTTISAYDVATELAYQMSIGVIPPLDLDGNGNVNSLYMVDFPGTITITDTGATSCKDFCAEHQTTQMTQNGVTYSVPYAIMPSQYEGPCKTSGGCGAGANDFNNSTLIASHELAESVTDTEIGLAEGLDAPIAWYDAVDQLAQGSAGGEIGDLCNAQAGIAAGYAVQKLWSNLNNQCIDAAPLCNGTTQPPYCTPCASTDDGVGCIGATPVCETSATSTHVGECVACTATSACPNGPASYCDTTSDTCRGCQPSDCTGGAAVCETTGTNVGQCVQCDPTNATACTGTTALCDPGTFTCVGCVTNATCSSGTPICDADAQVCRACESSGDCGSQVCETDTASPKIGQCVPCTRNADCSASSAGNVCKAGVCVVGTVDAGEPGSPDGGTKPAGMDASAGSTDAGAKDDGGSAGSGSRGGCSVGGSSAGGGELGWLAAIGMLALSRRKRR